MDLSQAIEEVLSLQHHYSSVNTDEMKRRGELLRNRIPGLLKPFGNSLAAAMDIERGDFLIEGRDGTGRKSQVPWVRFCSRELSPSATNGWYVVLLPRRDGEGVYLALAHGSARFNDGSLITRPDDELAVLMTWAKAVLGPLAALNQPLFEVSLGAKGDLALSYEKSCVVAFYYPAKSVPNDATLQQDMTTLAGFLGALYREERFGKMPYSINPEVRDAAWFSNKIARPSAAGMGLALLLTAQERRAVEVRAMTVAAQHLHAAGFKIKDVSAEESFDLLAVRGSDTVKVEVKGTTGELGKILLTQKEVRLHKDEHPANALIVVYAIKLTKGETPIADGGELKIWMPWLVEDDRLSCMAYAYDVT